MRHAKRITLGAASEERRGAGRSARARRGPGEGTELRERLFKETLLLLLAGTVTVGSAFANDDRTAKLTEKHGDVYKRGFVDWNREEWGAPAPARLGDHVAEGMQVGTGNKSWAQLTWKNVSARAWENSIYAVAPNQRLVYLMGGEMLFQLDKKRKDKSNYYVWTKLLQARMRGTTALVQADGNVARVTVLEGTIDVLNRVDHSLVRLQPGVVYEIRSRDSQSYGTNSAINQAMPSISAAKGTASATVSNTASSSGRSISGITVSGQPALPLFDSGSTLTSVLPLDPGAAMAHPLLQSFTSPLASLGLISSSLSGLPAGLSSVTGALSGVTGSLSAAVTPLTAAVGGLVSPVAAIVGDTVGGVVAPVAGVVGDTIGGMVAPVASVVGEAAGSVVAPLASTVGDTVGSLASPVTSAVAPVASAVAPITSAVAPITSAAAQVSAATPGTSAGATPLASIAEETSSPAPITSATSSVASPGSPIPALSAAAIGSGLTSSTGRQGSGGSSIGSPLASTSGALAPLASSNQGCSASNPGSISTAKPLVGSVGKSGKPELPPEVAVIVQNTEILQCPKRHPYKSGLLIGNLLAWPSNAGEFPPTGQFDVTAKGDLINIPIARSGNTAGTAGGALGANPVGTNIAGVTPTVLPGAGLGVGAQAGLSAGLGSLGAAIGSLGATSSVSGFAGSALGGAGAISTGIGSLTSGVGGLAGGVLPGGGAIGGVVGGLGGTVGGAVGSLGGTVGGVVGGLGGVVGGLGGVLSGGGGSAGGGGSSGGTGSGGGILPGSGGGLGGLLPGGGGGGLGGLFGP
jgi:hypothetical protein